jgi:hypothetical protein
MYSIATLKTSMDTEPCARIATTLSVHREAMIYFENTSTANTVKSGSKRHRISTIVFHIFPILAVSLRSTVLYALDSAAPLPWPWRRTSGCLVLIPQFDEIKAWQTIPHPSPSKPSDFRHRARSPKIPYKDTNITDGEKASVFPCSFFFSSLFSFGLGRHTARRERGLMYHEITILTGSNCRTFYHDHGAALSGTHNRWCFRHPTRP